MYIHMGDNFCVNDEDIIGIFDIENTSANETTRNFLRCAGERKSVEYLSYEMPKSFIVCSQKDKKEIIYISRIAVSTLRKRAELKDGLQNWRFQIYGSE